MALGRFIPFPHFVELEIANNDIGRAFDIECGVADGRTVGREDGEPAVFGFDIDDTDPG